MSLDSKAVTDNSCLLQRRARKFPYMAKAGCLCSIPQHFIYDLTTSDP